MNRINKTISTGDPKPKTAASTKKKTGGRSAKLKSSKWYQDAAGSMGINKRKKSHSP